MSFYSLTDNAEHINNDLLPNFQVGKSLNTPVNDMVASPVPISVSQSPLSSAKKFTTSHPITPILDFKTGFVFLEKEKDNTLEKSNNSSIETYTDSVERKAKFINFKKKILQNLQGGIK